MIKTKVWLGLMVLISLAAITAPAPTSETCGLQISTSPNGSVLFTCPATLCDDYSSCELVTVFVAGVWYYSCGCGNQTQPYNPCEGGGQIDAQTSVWTYTCVRNYCAKPCKEFGVPNATPQKVCRC